MSMVARANIWLALPWLQLTEYTGPIYLILFTNALNLTRATGSLAYLEGDPPPITHSSLRFLTVKCVGLELLPYLTLPALQYLDVTADGADFLLEAFMTRSSPPLISLSVQAGDPYTVLHHRIHCVHNTLENLQLRRPSAQAMSSLFPSQGESIISLASCPNLRSLCLQDVSCDHGRYYYPLVKFLYSASHLRSFGLVWSTNSIHGNGAPNTIHKFDTIKGHLSRIANAGMEVYFGTKEKNYAAMDHIDEIGRSPA
ncbi:hypothetical protein B0H12DRAFT_198511 [Mycena haematopus]|nr:hypothetical protein B0H12DRAFT_198511 [Mycena haematopus]